MAADSDTDSVASQLVDLTEDREWEDAEEDIEDVTFVSLFSDKTFKHLQEMLADSKINHGFDIWKVQQNLELDDLERIKLINYIRSEVKAGTRDPDVTSKSAFLDDKYLQPVLEDDAVLYSLDDVLDTVTNTTPGVNQEIEALREQLASLQMQFQNYRADVQRTLSQQIGFEDGESPNSDNAVALKGKSHVDDGYFESYSYNSIHHTMLSDKIRTDAYRDFIYDNKDLFAGKTVLDVGCGTGILSMFCARAGAKQVIAVDNSEIISKARENIRLNQLDDRILCLKGKIEEVLLPVEKVDIIVSEWMGYCLLYESMLDSVIYARDRYLTEEGLMVPSHAILQIAPLADSDLKADHIDFWRDVYGFNMIPMLEKAHEEVIIRTVDPKELAADACCFKTFDLHKAVVSDLSFEDSFSLSWKPDFKELEGFVIWFDMFFARDRSERGQLDTATAAKQNVTTFSTGPSTMQTHWQQGVLLIDDMDKSRQEDFSAKYKADNKLRGRVTFSRKTKESRHLDIKIEVTGDNRQKPLMSQQWTLE